MVNQIKFRITRRTSEYNKYIKWFRECFNADGILISSIGYKTEKEARAQIKRVKRLTCKDCCYLNENICGVDYRELSRNGCLVLPPPHFTFKGHRYRPGFMELRQEKSGEIWVYYNFHEEQKYDSTWHADSHGAFLGHGGR
ncbi:hypothetical protein LCGC14_1227010 [marine sediment metagenome]|uniref:Uncharacterized protein n=1 Tax=marine sediment metagenome TaxID=412755 RepID=A0A0F9L9J5_9ZZZZ